MCYLVVRYPFDTSKRSTRFCPTDLPGTHSFSTTACASKVFPPATGDEKVHQLKDKNGRTSIHIVGGDKIFTQTVCWLEDRDTGKKLRKRIPRVKEREKKLPR